MDRIDVEGETVSVTEVEGTIETSSATFGGVLALRRPSQMNDEVHHNIQSKFRIFGNPRIIILT